MSEQASEEVFLVVGGSGFLGRHIVQKILQQHGTVSVLDIVQRYHDTPFYSGSVCSLEDLCIAIEKSGTTCIIHTASPPPTAGDPVLLEMVNVEGTRNVVLAAQKKGVQKLVFTSSCGVLFQGSDLNGVDETHPVVEPENHIQDYYRTKAVAESLVLQANGMDGLVTCALRPAGIFGPGDRFTIDALFEIYIRGQSRIQIGDNQKLFDWTYVTNVADAHLLAAEKLGTTPSEVAGQVFIITNDQPVRFWDFTNEIHAGFDRLLGQNVASRRRFVIPQGLAYILALFVEFFAWLFHKKTTFNRMTVVYGSVARWHNIEKAKRVFGYSPSVSVEDGIHKTITWWGQERGLKVEKY